MQETNIDHSINNVGVEGMVRSGNLREGQGQGRDFCLFLLKNWVCLSRQKE